MKTKKNKHTLKYLQEQSNTSTVEKILDLQTIFQYVPKELTPTDAVKFVNKLINFKKQV